MRKRLLKQSVALGLVMVLGAVSLSGCGKKEAGEAGSDKPVNLEYYTIGSPDKDLKQVNDELNKMLLAKDNLTINYNKISWGDYGTKLSTLINSGGNFDVAFAAASDQGDYAGNAQKGAWLELDEWLAGEGKELYDSIDEKYWEGVRVDGKIYGIPTNKEIAVPEQWMYPKEIVDKYNIDITKLTSLDSLEPVLKELHEKEPDWLGMELDRNSHNFFALDGYEWVFKREVPLMFQSSDAKLEVVNIFETDLAKDRLDTLRKYYKAGYINEDAAVKESGMLEKGKKVFWKQAGGGPYSEIGWIKDRGYDLVANPVTAPVVTTESARGGVMVVNKLSKNKDAALKFLKTLNTDPEIRNTINYGVEGVHYKLTDDGQVDAYGSDRYVGVAYTQGNWFILNTLKGEPKDKWDVYQKFNDSAVVSEALGFTPDISELTNEIASVSTVFNKYASGLLTGSVEVDTELPKFNKELKDAGIEKIQQELQKQVDEWKAAQTK